MNSAVMTDHDLQRYLADMSQPGAWGDGIMLSAAVNFYNRPITILSVNGEQLVDTATMSSASPLRLGLVNQNHYVSINKRQTKTEVYGTDHGPHSATSATTETQPVHSSTCSEKGYMSSISNELKSTPVPDDLAADPTLRPTQPLLSVFPSQQHGTQTRRMNAGLYKQFPFIEYSVSRDAVYCFPCRMFQSNTERTEAVFTQSGFSKWKAVHEKLRKHSSTATHCHAVTAWHTFRQSQESGSCRVLLDNQRRADIESNRSYIKTIAKVAVTCARQGIALRDHRESAESSNRGNFLEFLNLLASDNPTFKSQRANVARNAEYLHHDIQNDLLHICASMILNVIVDEVVTAGSFAIMVDESADLTLTEQMSFCVRYVHNCEVKERYLGFYDVHEVDAAGLARRGSWG